MTIAAIATAEGTGGVAVVRLSGPGSLGIARAMFSRKGDMQPNVMYPGEIDGGTFRDFGLCVFFRAPKSFTGEDVVEFHCHGGREIARGILKHTFELGARPAERGEFTKRAFLNGKLSLSAAEGMADMIHARSEAEIRAGYLLLHEVLTEEGRRMQEQLTDCLAAAEADIDFPEEDLGTWSRTEIGQTVRAVEASLSELLSRYTAGRKLKEGVRVVLAGRPNAGKSSLFNALLGYDRAIVSDTAGTTRDTLEGELTVHGVRFLLIDTAGLCTGADLIEAEGVRRAEGAIRAADLILYLREKDDGVELPADTPVITVAAKCDLGRRADCDVAVSSRTGEGLDTLRELIYERGYGRENDGVFLLEARHYEALKRAREEVRSARTAIEDGLAAELYLEDLRAARRTLGEITGDTASESVINAIFEKFCVGK